MIHLILSLALVINEVPKVSKRPSLNSWQSYSGREELARSNDGRMKVVQEWTAGKRIPAIVLLNSQGQSVGRIDSGIVSANEKPIRAISDVLFWYSGMNPDADCGPNNEMLAGAFSPDNRRVAVAHRNRVRIWNTSDLHRCGSVNVTKVRHVTHLEFSSDGRELHISGAMGEKVVVDGFTGARLASNF